MAKRFTDTDKYKKPFIRGLQGPYKLLWDYLYHDCNHAGIWIVNFEIAQIYLGKDMQVNKEDALKYFNSGMKRIIEFNGGDSWFIPCFIEFQYGELNEANRAHKSAIQILKASNLWDIFKGLGSPLQGTKDKDKDKDMDKDKVARFKKPTVIEIQIYCNERNNGIDAEYFFDYHERCDWLLKNGNKVKDWKATVRTWEKNKIRQTSPSKPSIVMDKIYT